MVTPSARDRLTFCAAASAPTASKSGATGNGIPPCSTKTQTKRTIKPYSRMTVTYSPQLSLRSLPIVPDRAVVPLMVKTATNPGGCRSTCSISFVEVAASHSQFWTVFCDRRRESCASAGRGGDYCGFPDREGLEAPSRYGNGRGREGLAKPRPAA